MFVLPLTPGRAPDEYGDFSTHGEVVAVLDPSAARMAAYNKRQAKPLPAYGPDQFDRMVEETKPDVIAVAGPDSTHVDYIVAALRRGLDVVTEKPMTANCDQARAVLTAERASRGRVRVIHNLRYQNVHRQIKQIIHSGLIGKVTNVELVWNLDTFHGASYFYRWNRDRAISGGLSVTKSCHHFDLINWFLDDIPEQVFAYGARNYYGAGGAHDPNPPGSDPPLSIDAQKASCPYHQRWYGPGSALHDDHLVPSDPAFDLPPATPKAWYIYDRDISIEDTYSAVVRYRSGASMTYSLNASAPWEGYRLGINGTHGRIETAGYTASSRCPFPANGPQSITVLPLFGPRQVHDTSPASAGGHGGADLRLKRELYIGELHDSADLNLAADAANGAYAVAVGEAVWRSVQSGAPVSIADLLSDVRHR